MVKPESKVVLTPDQRKLARSKAKMDAFKKLATKRVNAVLTKLEGINALSNRNSYTWDDTQVQKIFTALEGAIAAAKKRFDTKNPAAVAGFEL